MSAKEKVPVHLRNMDGEWVHLTPELAERYLSTRYEQQRVMRANHVARLVASIKAGEWIPNGEPLQFDKDGRMFDGQHRCQAVVEANRPIWVRVVRNVPIEAYAVVDTGSARLASDILKFAGIPNATLIAAAVSWCIAYDVEGIYPSTRRVVSILEPSRSPTHAEIEHYYTENAAMQEYVPIARACRLLLTPAVALFLAYKTHLSNKEKAEAFWNAIMGDAQVGVHSPMYHLLEILSAAKREPNIARNRLTPMEAAFAVGRAWLAFVAGKRVTSSADYRWSGKKGHQRPFPRL